MSDQNKPCPFCGSTNVEYVFSSSQGYITCSECDCDGPYADEAADPECSIEAAWAIWDKRSNVNEIKSLAIAELTLPNGKVIPGKIEVKEEPVISVTYKDPATVIPEIKNEEDLNDYLVDRLNERFKHAKITKDLPTQMEEALIDIMHDLQRADIIKCADIKFKVYRDKDNANNLNFIPANNETKLAILGLNKHNSLNDFEPVHMIIEDEDLLT